MIDTLLELPTMKQYLRVDFDDDDALIEALMVAAEAFLLNAGVRKQQTDKLYQVVVMMLTTLFYENRSENVPIPSMLRNLIVQLSSSGDQNESN